MVHPQGRCRHGCRGNFILGHEWTCHREPERMSAVTGTAEKACGETARTRPRHVRALWNAAGTFFLAVGMIGVPLPFLPTTPFLILAAACYMRGSPRMHRWMLTNRYFGAYLKSYIEGKGLPVKTKVVSIATLWAVILFSALVVTESVIVRAVLLVVGIGVTIHLAALKTCPSPRDPRR